jgi:hypothetical protein
MLSRVALIGLLVAGCERPEPRAIPVSAPSPVVAQVERFVAAGKTPSAYAALAVSLADARVGNPAVAADAELRVVGLAADLAESMRSRPIGEQAAAHALTVWPALLGTAAAAGESADAYIERLCAGPLRTECGGVAPEQHAVVVRAAVMRTADERMHEALSTCLECRNDLEWSRIGWTWESLDRDASGQVAGLRGTGVIAAQ